MINRGKHSDSTNGTAIYSFVRDRVVVCLVVCLFLTVSLEAQVLNNQGAAVSVNGAVVTGQTVQNGGMMVNKGEIKLTGNWTNTGSLNSDAGIISFEGFSHQKQTITKSGGETFYHFNLNSLGDSVQINNPLIVNGNANFALGLISTGYNVDFMDEVICGLGKIYAWNGTVTYPGLATHVIEGTYYNLTLQGNSVKTLCGNITVLNKLTIEGGTLELGSYSITVNGPTSISGILSDNNMLGSNLFEGTVTINSGGGWNFAGNADVELRGGITNNGISFVSGNGNYSFTNSCQNMAGSSPITFHGDVIIGTGVTLTNMNTASTYGVTYFAGLNGLDTASKYVNQTITSYEGSLPGYGLPMSQGILDASYAGNIFRYSGSTQSIAIANYYNLEISGDGNKTLDGDITVHGNLTVKNATSLIFGAGAVHTLDVFGDMDAAAGTIVMSNGNNMNHVLKLRGIHNSCNLLIADDQSVVDYLGGDGQQVFASTKYRNILFAGTGTKILQGDVTATGNNITLSANVDAGSNELFLSNSLVTITRTAGSIIGNLKRSLTSTSIDYLYPVGAASTYNPMVINFTNLTVGNYLVKYVAGDVGNAGLPLNDNGVEVYDRFSNGYWETKASNSLASNNYNISLTADGFGIDASSRILKKEGGNLFVDGSHDTIIGSVISQHSMNEISTSNTTIVIGKGRPFIVSNPVYTVVCEWLNISFAVAAKGVPTLTYQWQVDDGSGFVDLSDGGIYSNTKKDTLKITGVPLTINNYLYRCVITDGTGNPNTTTSAMLTVNPTPVISLIPSSDVLCNSTNALISPSSTVPGSIYSWTVSPDAGITGTSNGSNFTISQALSNANNFVSRAVYTIKPISTKGCEGNSMNDTIYVNPTALLQVSVPKTVVCDSTVVNFTVTDKNASVKGDKVYQLTSSQSGGVLNVQASGEYAAGTMFSNRLINSTRSVQSVIYQWKARIKDRPGHIGQFCDEGTDTTITIYVNPTARITVEAIRDSICYNEGITFSLGNPNVTIGTWAYDIITTVSDPGVTGWNTAHDATILNYTDPIVNTTDTVQYVTYRFIPKIKDPTTGVAYCNEGIDTTIIVMVAPEIKTTLIPVTYIGGKNIKCYGFHDGSVYLSRKGGYHPAGYNYLWSNGAITRNVTGLIAGNYAVTVQDKLGCTAHDQIVLSQPDKIKSTVDSLLNIGCIQGKKGFIYITVTGGTAPYLYNWNSADGKFSSTSRNILNLDEGAYKLNIADPNNCKLDTSYFLFNAPITWNDGGASSYGDKNISCKGRHDGSLDPKFPQDIKWAEWTGPNNLKTNQLKLSNLGAGLYNLNVISTLGCSSTFTKELLEPDTFIYQATVGNYSAYYNLACEGDSNGSVLITNVSGGHGNYQYTWTALNGGSGIVGGATQTSLKAGTYALEIRDLVTIPTVVSYCMVRDTFILTQPQPLTVYDSIPLYNDYAIACNGGSTGDILLKVTTDSHYSPTYHWSGTKPLVDGVKDQSNILAGTYNLKITYNGVCNKDYSFVLAEPQVLAIDSVKANDILCFGKNTGNIQILTKGGITPYDWNWTSADGKGFSASSESQTNIGAGHYSVLVTDSNGCVVARSFLLSQPDSFQVRLTKVPITCVNAIGSLSSSASGGISPYTYAWYKDGSFYSNLPSITNIAVSPYELTVKDMHDCSVSLHDTIESAGTLILSPVVVSDYHSQNISCLGAKDGMATVKVIRGKAPFRYRWSTGDTTAILSNADATTYGVTVYDQFFCTGSTQVTLTQPTAVQSTFSKQDLTCNSIPTGSITANGTGGTAPYGYLWSNGQVGQSVSNLGAGKYVVKVSDVNNCSIDQTIYLSEPDSMKVSREISLPACPEAADGKIKLTVTGGLQPYTPSWSSTSDNAFELDRLNIGTYIYKVSDANNCITTDSVKLSAKFQICVNAPKVFSPNGDGVNDCWEVMAGNPDSPVPFNQLFPNGIVKIYNRWGILIFESNEGYTNKWCGTMNGRPLPIDSYFYLIDPKNGAGMVKGIITIIK
jgi:gliding motility-associated-like protein